jgi:hypothetical protein
MAMNIEYRDAPYYERPFGGGRKIRRVEAHCGSLRGDGANRTEAKAALMERIELQLRHAYTRRYLRTADVTFALYYADGWSYDIVAGDGARYSSTGLGACDEREAYQAMSRHFLQYIGGKDMGRVDRTNGELDAAILAYRDDPSEENRDRCLKAQQAHTDAFYAEQTEEFQARLAG